MRSYLTLRNVALVFAIAVALFALHERDDALRRAGAAEARAHVADSLLVENGRRLARVDTVLVQRTQSVRQALARVDTIRQLVVDTLFAIEDTSRAVPLVAIPSSTFNFLTDTLAPKCDALAKDCEKFRAEAQERFRLYEMRINSTATSVCPSRVKPALVSGVLGAAAGVLWSSLR